MTKKQPFVIPKDEISEVKRWRLPYWTDKPVWASDRVDKDLRKKSRVKVILPETQQQPSASGAVDDIAPTHTTTTSTVKATDLPNLPTAEELEIIRREAYNEGLEQGRVEGRQQGHQEGFDAGFSEGKEQGLTAGTQEGYDTGLEQGKEAGVAQARAETNMVVMRLERVMASLNSNIVERDQQLPEVLSQLVRSVCQHVVGDSLKDGAANIYELVQKAMLQIPEGEQHVKVFVGPDDAKHLQASIEDTGAQLNYQVDKNLPAGACRIESEHSLVEFSTEEHLQQVLADIQQQMRKALQFPEAEIIAETESTPELTIDSEPEASQAEETTVEAVTATETETPAAEAIGEQHEPE